MYQRSEMVIVKWEPIVPRTETVCLKKIAVLFRTLRHKTGDLSARRFVNIVDGFV